MMETDDKLIRAFFAEQKQEIPDNGFSRRVMNRLPCRTSLLIKVWSLFIMLVAIILFLVFDGLQQSLPRHVIYSSLWYKTGQHRASTPSH